MKTIHKFKLDSSGTTKVKMPIGTKPVKVAVQGWDVQMWAEVHTGALIEDRYFTVYGTGQDIPDEHVYIDTFFSSAYVWHVYEEIL